MKRARHKKEKQIEAQAASAEQHHESGSGDGAQPVGIEVEHAPVDSREGEKQVFIPPEKEWFSSMINQPSFASLSNPDLYFN